MKWEYLGQQDLPAPGVNRFTWSIATKSAMWRGKVPGGWLVLVITGISNSSIGFYPDPSYLWDGKSLDETPADFLLRPAEASSESDSRQLLRADNPDEKA